MMARAWPLAILLVVAAGGCRPEAAEDWARLERMEQEIRALVLQGSCKGDAECAVLPLGAKPCGGPWGYLVYSPATVDTTQLFVLADAYTAYNLELNAKHGMASDCAIQPEPQPACRNDRCVDELGLYDDGIPPGASVP